VKTNK